MFLRSFVLVLLVCLGVFAEGYTFLESLTPPSSSNTLGSFGEYVTLSDDGTTMVVSAASTQVGAVSNAGSVLVYKKVNGVWNTPTEFTEPTPSANRFFGKDSACASSDYVVIGLPEDAVNGPNTGVAFYTKWDGSSWSSLSRIETPSGTAFFGARCRFKSATELYVSSINSGHVAYFDLVGNSWVYNNRIVSTAFTAFGENFRFFDNGNKIVVTARADNSNVGRFYTYENVGGTWTLIDTTDIPAPYNAGGSSWGTTIAVANDGSSLAITSLTYDPPGLTNPGTVMFFEWDGSNWVFQQILNGEQQVQNGTPLSLTNFGKHLWYLSGKYYVSYHQSAYDSNNDNNYELSRVGRLDIVSKTGGTYSVEDSLYPNTKSFFSDCTVAMQVIQTRILIGCYARIELFEIPPQCTVSADCAGANEYCAASTCASTACTTTSDCMGLFSSHLPLCGVSGYCRDSMSGTCTTLEDCQNKINLAKARTKSIGAATKTISNLGGGDARAAVKSLNTKIYNTSSATDLTTVVTGSETAIFSPSLFTSVGNNTLVLEEIKNILCGNATAFCNVAIDNNRRMLQGGDITVSVTYDIDSSIFDTLPEGSFDDPAFIQALADAVGVGSGNVTILQSESSFTILYAVTSESSTNDPLTDENLQAIDDLVSNLDAVTQTVVTELGISQSAISSTSVDRCADRDCNGRGTCNPDTGACTCTDPNYWGLNCETLVVCENDGVNVPINNVPYCMCMYPYFGSRCQTLMDCECTAV